jgi:hypothetical protein
VICPHPSLVEGDTAQEQEENTWTVFNGLCQKAGWSTLRWFQTLSPEIDFDVRQSCATSYVLFTSSSKTSSRVCTDDAIDRDSTILDIVQSRSAASENPGESLLPSGPALASSSLSKNTQEDELGTPPRREYVWRKMDRGQQSLATVANRIALDLDMNLSSLRRMSWTDRRSAHRCAGYVREEITLATTTLDSAVVAHDSPGLSELCPICHEVVGLHEMFRCTCGDFG